MKLLSFIKLIKFIRIYSNKKFKRFLIYSFLLSICDLTVLYVLSTSFNFNTEVSIKEKEILSSFINMVPGYGLITIVLIAISLRIFIQFLINLYMRQFASWLSIQLYNSSIKTTHTEFLEISPEEYVSRLRFETNFSIDNTFLPTFDLIQTLFSLIIITIFTLLITGVKYFYLIFIAGLIFFAFTSLIKGKTTNLSKIINLASQNSSKIVTNIVSSPRTYFLTSYSNLADNEYRRSENKLWYAKTFVRFISLIPRSIFELFIVILFIVFLSNNSDNFLNSSATTLMIIAFIRSFPFIVNILSNFSLISSSYTVSNKIIKTVEDYKKNLYKSNKNRIIKNIPSKVLLDLKEVTFFFENNNKKNYIFKEFNYTFLKNKSYFLTGKSGAGKSTLLDLISGLQEPNQGEIEIYSQRNNDQNNLMKIEYLSQNLILPTITIREFLQLGEKKELKEKNIYQALEIVELLEIINNMEMGLDTLLVHNAFKLSGGQKQRLLIANLYLKNPDLIIIDEGLTGIEQSLAKKILESITLKTRSTIIVTSHDEAIIPEKLFETIKLNYINNKKIN